MTAENITVEAAVVAPDSASMRPRPMTAENLPGRRPRPH